MILVITHTYRYVYIVRDDRTPIKCKFECIVSCIEYRLEYRENSRSFDYVPEDKRDRCKHISISLLSSDTRLGISRKYLTGESHLGPSDSRYLYRQGYYQATIYTAMHRHRYHIGVRSKYKHT